MSDDLLANITQIDVERRFPIWFNGAYCGWNVGAGWQHIIFTLCIQIENILNRYKVPHNVLVVAQVKEKFGHLCFYCEPSYDNVSDDLGVLEDLAWEEINEARHIAYEHSTRTCEYCGEPGTLDTSQHWRKVRCPICTAKGTTWRDVEGLTRK